MNVNFKLEVVAALQWGLGADEAPLVLQESPSFGEMSLEQIRKVPAPVQIRLDAMEGLHALTASQPGMSASARAFVYHFDASGQLKDRTPISPLEMGETDESFTLDYQADEQGNCYLLEETRRSSDRPRHRLRKVGFDGTDQWARALDDAPDHSDLSEANLRLLMDGRSHVYLAVAAHTGVIAEIDRASGDLTSTYRPEAFSSRVFINKNAVVFYTLYFPQMNRRGFGTFNLANGQAKSLVGGPQLYGLLLYPIGVDAAENLYVWSDSTISRVSFDARVEVVARLNNVVVRASDSCIFSSYVESGSGGELIVQVERHSFGGAPMRQALQIPPLLSGADDSEWRLIHVDDQGRHYVFGGEAPGRAGTLTVYSADGGLNETVSPPPNLLALESTLERHTFWVVDSVGRIYLPVTDGRGFKIVRLSV